MDPDKKMGPEAAATAFRTLAVPFRKQTVLLCPKWEVGASAFLYLGAGE